LDWTRISSLFILVKSLFSDLIRFVRIASIWDLVAFVGEWSSLIDGAFFISWLFLAILIGNWTGAKKQFGKKGSTLIVGLFVFFAFSGLESLGFGLLKSLLDFLMPWLKWSIQNESNGSDPFDFPKCHFF
jgi:hypothetical protein